MVIKMIAPYGFWESPITIETVDGKTKGLASPRVDVSVLGDSKKWGAIPKVLNRFRQRKSGRAFFTETTEDGRNTIMEVLPSGVKEVLPAPYSAQDTVYEYGGAPYSTVGPGRLIFSDRNGSVKLLTLDGDTRAVADVVGGKHLRYADFDGHPTGPWVVAVQEDHERDTPSEVRNYVVAINYERGTVKRIVEGADFYYLPRLSPDGSAVAWLEWDNPELPFADAKLYVAECEFGESDVVLGQKVLVAGGRKQGVAEPRWGENGTLFFAREAGGYRRPFMLATPRSLEPEKVRPIPMEVGEAEFGEIALVPSR